MDTHQTSFEVLCDQCGERHYTDEVEFLNIEEDYQGRDVMYFKCPVTGKITSSNVYRK